VLDLEQTKDLLTFLIWKQVLIYLIKGETLNTFLFKNEILETNNQENEKDYYSVNVVRPINNIFMVGNENGFISGIFHIKFIKELIKGQTKEYFYGTI
jgi:hypothetical protein